MKGLDVQVSNSHSTFFVDSRPEPRVELLARVDGAERVMDLLEGIA